MAVMNAGVGALRMDSLHLSHDGEMTTGTADFRIMFSPGNYTDYDTYYVFGSGDLAQMCSGIADTVDGQLSYSITDAEVSLEKLFGLMDRGRIPAAEAYLFRADDTINGGNRGDYLSGFNGDDAINGGRGADRLVGGKGQDMLTGGNGADRFLYFDATESTVGKRGRDTILDFHHRQGDTIDLSAIDANQATSRNESFSFVGAFTGHAGELFVAETRDGFLVQADTTGDGQADFAILVNADAPLVANDFTL